MFVPESWASGTELTWAIRRTSGGELLGVIGVREPRHEIGYWMGAAHRGAGLMSEAAVAVADWALAGGIRGATTLFWRAVEGNVAVRHAWRRPPGSGGSSRPIRPCRHATALRCPPGTPCAPCPPIRSPSTSWTDVLGPR